MREVKGGGEMGDAYVRLKEAKRRGAVQLPAYVLYLITNPADSRRYRISEMGSMALAEPTASDSPINHIVRLLSCLLIRVRYHTCCKL